MKPGDWASVYMDHTGRLHYFQWDYALPPGMTYEERFWSSLER